MLKWTVSRSLSTASSTPHGPGGGGDAKTSRRPFRDLSNTPPASSGSSRTSTGAQDAEANEGPRSSKRTPSRKRRCRSHGSDLRGMFGGSKPSLRSEKRQSMSRDSNSPVVLAEGFYQSTPRVDADIGPLTLFHPPHYHHHHHNQQQKQRSSLTLPVDPQVLPLVNEARANNLQSHVTDFFQQISMATSPEDVMESESLPFASKRRRYPINSEAHHTPHLPKLARITKLQARNKTPYHTKVMAEGERRRRTRRSRSIDSCVKSVVNEMEVAVRQTPLAGKLSTLDLEDDKPANTNEDKEQSTGYKTVAEIILNSSEERRKVLESDPKTLEEHIYEEIPDREEEKTKHNDSSVSSASQLLENPSPESWPFCSPSSDLEGEFPLKRQRVIRRKRQAKDTGNGSNGKRLKLPLIEAVNRHVKRLHLETDLDSSTFADKEATEEPASVQEPEDEPMQIEEEIPEDDTLKRDLTNATTSQCSVTTEQEEQPSRKASTWDTDSPRSSMLDSFATSGVGTPEGTPLVATVRRCLKYSPETPMAGGNSCCRSHRGCIEIESSVSGDQIHVKIVRCRDLIRRGYEGPIHAYVKAILKDVERRVCLCVKRTAVHKATPCPVFNETLVLALPPDSRPLDSRRLALEIAVWHRDRRKGRSELLGCMTLPLPLSQDKEVTWHPLEASSGRNSSCTAPAYGSRDFVVSPPLSKDGADSIDNNNSTSGDDLSYLRHLELEPVDPLTGLPLHPVFAARGGRTPCTITRRLVRPPSNLNQVTWGFSLSWGRPPRVERVDPGSPAERSGLRPGDYVVFVDSANVVTQSREYVLECIQAATNQLILEVYRRSGLHHASTTASTTTTTATTLRRQSSSVNVTLQAPPAIGVVGSSTTTAAAPGVHHATVAFTAEMYPHLSSDASPEEELAVREMRYWTSLKSGQARFITPLAERRDILSATDHMILFQNLDELLKLSEEIRDEGGGLDSYLARIPRITAAYRRYLGGLQRACCLLVALRKNSSFAKIVCEPAIPRRRKPDITGVLLQPLEHYREMTRLLCLACPRNSGAVRDLAQGYRESTASASVMEPPRESGRPLLSLQEVESRLVFARCKPFSLVAPGRQWLFGGALSKVEGRGRSQAMWALLLTDLLVFARVSRDRVLFVTEEPLKLSCIAEACFTIRKRPTEFRLQITTQPSAPGVDPAASTEVVQCAGTTGSGVPGGCSPHSRLRRRLLVLRAPSPELKAVWHNLLQRQIIYVNTNSGGGTGLESPDDPDDDSPTNPGRGTSGGGGGTILNYLSGHRAPVPQRDLASSPEIYRSTQQLQEEDMPRSGDTSIELMMMKDSGDRRDHREPQPEADNHLAQWVRNSHQIPPPDQEVPIEEWTVEELAARTPMRESAARDFSDAMEENTVVNSDAEQQSSASSASQSTVKSNSLPSNKKDGSGVSSPRDASSPSSINMCRRCHRSGCQTTTRDPFSPLPPRISVLPPTPDYCARHQHPRLRNGLYDSPSRNSPSRGFSTDGNTEDGSEDDLEDEPPYRALRRFGTLSSLDQDEELEERTIGEEEVVEPPASGGLRAWTLRASSYVVSKMSILHPPVPPERTESSTLHEPNNGDEEGTTSGGTSGDDIWGTPTSGGPDDESFTGSPPASCGNAHLNLTTLGEDNYGLSLQYDDESEGEFEELNMEQLLMGNSVSCPAAMSASSLRSFLGRRRLEPLPEEEDSLSVGSGYGGGSNTGGKYNQVGWW